MAETNSGLGANPIEPNGEAADGGFFTGILTDRFCWIILGCGVLISLVGIAVLYPGYNFSKHDTAWRRYAHNPEKYDDPDFYAGVVYMQKRVPDLIDFPLMRGQSARMLGHYEESIQAFNDALKIQPNYQLHSEIGLTYEKMGDKAKAIEEFSMAYKQNPADPTACYYLGVAAFEGGRYQEAGALLLRTANSPDYNAKAEPYRKQIMEKMVGQVDLVDTKTLSAVLAEATPVALVNTTTATTQSTAGATTGSKH